MNPFDLYGPQFLFFYFILLFIGGGILFLFWRSLGRDEMGRRPITDPYRIAYLRGGPKEAVKIVAASLTHRRCAKVIGDTITAEEGQAGLATNEMERIVLEECRSGATLQNLAEGRSAATADRLFHQPLLNEYLILSADQRQQALVVKIIVVGSLVAVAAIKILLAMQRGKHNVTFLIVLALFGTIALSQFKFWRTPNGSTALKDLKILFNRSVNQASNFIQPSQNHQFTFLVAVFGISSLSVSDYTFLSAFKPKKGNNSGCGSSCGSSCSSGCGGGGGCGGCGS